MVIVPHPPFMGLTRGFVTCETFLVFQLANLDGRCRFIGCGHVVFRSLEIKPVSFIGENRGLVCQLPVGADGYFMTLIASSRRGNRLPCLEHGTAADKENRKDA
jgi:hypothetical protein